LLASRHYYVISLSTRANALLEAFRDTLIDIENGGFPVLPDESQRETADPQGRIGRLRDALRTVDRCFSVYQRQEPLNLVVVGEGELIRMFSSVTDHGDDVVGRIEGDYSATSLRDLGKIVWPLVRDAMSGMQERAMHDLEVARDHHTLISGIDSVVRSIGAARGATLLVEGDYHVRGSIYETDAQVTTSRDVYLTAAMDDIVDVVIEMTVAAGGHVVFLPNGALEELGRIALVFVDAGETQE